MIVCVHVSLRLMHVIVAFKKTLNLHFTFSVLHPGITLGTLLNQKNSKNMDT